MEDKNNIVLLHLSLIKNIGPIKILKIIKSLDDNLIVLYSFKSNDFVSKFGINKNTAQLLVDGLQDKEILEKELSLITKYQIDLYTIVDDQYPELLKQIHSPPIVLYCKGAKLENYKNNFSIVGSRNATEYAQQVVNNIVPDLVNNGYHIISGGALGIDTMAHEVTVKAGGKTLIILGSGLLKPYPRENIEFFRSIIKDGNGTLISPFPLLMDPERGNFPSRNRIIAGLSSGCLVVQAAEKSGALITAQYALDEGRQVFAIPGNIFNKVSIGCHNIIKQGAKLVDCVDDILEEFGQTNCCKNNEKISEVAKTEVVKDPIESLILQYVGNVSSVDELSIKVNLHIDELQERLFDLQLDGKIRQNFVGFWERVY